MNLANNSNSLANAARTDRVAGMGTSPLDSSSFASRRAATPDHVRLTDREKQTLRLVCDGLSNRVIATRLGVSPETTKSELKRIFRKIEVKNRTQAAVLLVRQGLI